MKFLKNIKNNLATVIPLITESNLLCEKVVVVPNRYLLVSLTCLKTHFVYQYSLLSCISGVDLLKSNYRFSVVYDLLSIIYNVRIRVKTFIDNVTSVLSVTNLYKSANWWEREIWDMFGIYFENHPDLRRILTDYGFEGYPLRKNFPLSGFVEVRYDEVQKRVITEIVTLSQEYRTFRFTSPW
jgi:NADH/F420H2 dehydrogenase subunit C